MIIMTPRLSKAINAATWAHRNQHRKGSDLPYILHPYTVMCIASEVTRDEDTLIACLFHDILEDVPDEFSAKKMRNEFGDNVVTIVKGVTKNDSIHNWHARSEAYIHHLSTEAPDQSVIVAASDKIHNLMSILADYEVVGDQLWSRFSTGRDDQIWWYKAVAAVIKSRLPELSLNQTLAELITQLEQLSPEMANSYALPITGMPDFDVWLMSIGNDEQLGFIKANNQTCSYVRMTIGSTTARGSARSGQILEKCILSVGDFYPEPVSFNRYYNARFPARRIWVVFEAVKTINKKRVVVGHYAALSPVENKWYKLPGRKTMFEVKKVSLQEYHQLSSGIELGSSAGDK